ncbi:hypothetical protein BH11PSE3_BH11PSE3_49820 [soil metagenome]
MGLSHWQETGSQRIRRNNDERTGNGAGDRRIGFIGSWCVIRLLQQGYTVRTTVRSLARESTVRAVITKEVDPQDRLSFHALDLTSDAGWSEAASGCDYMLHVASPVALAEPKRQRCDLTRRER